ncbi:MAG TPA: hypothetical protein VF368_08095 [Gemmatimonadaceae bacterium]
MNGPNALLTHDQLSRLTRELRATPVLSVYIDGAAPDPARRLAWRQTLRNALDDARSWAESQPKASREAFDRCRQSLTAALDEIPSAIGSPGWVGFFTAEGMHLHGPVPTPMPTLVKWQVGPWVAPFVRALKQIRPVIVVVVDTRSAALYRYHRGELTDLEQLHSHRHGGHADHMGDAPREHFHGGTRGETATDAAEHARLAARDHMLREITHRFQELLNDDGVAVIGGAPDTAHALHRAIPAALAPRVLVSVDLPMGSSRAEIARAAERDAKILRDSRDAAAVERVLSLAGSHGRGVTGAKETLAVMSTGEGRQLLITPRFLAEHPDEAEAAVEFALDHAADIEVLSGDAAARLDASVGGIGASLRFALGPHPSESRGPQRADDSVAGHVAV